VEPFIKILKADLADLSNLGHSLRQLSETIKESDDSLLFQPLPGKLPQLIERLKNSKVPFSFVSPSHLHLE
jgi:hypothetical protein